MNSPIQFMGRTICVLLLLTVPSTSLIGADGIQIQSRGFTAHVRCGSVVGLTAADGTQYAGMPAESRGATIHRADTSYWVTADAPAGTLAPDQSLTRTYETFSGLSAPRIETDYEIEAGTGDLILRQRASASETGIWGVGWWIADIPLDYAILVPGGSGLRLTRDTPGPTFQYDYPMMWEAQCVIVEGPRGGFYVWAEDPNGRYKRLIVERRPTGWRLGLITINDAPFDPLTSCESVPWRLNTYEGDWRVPAGRYRKWFQETSRPVAIADQHPAWVKDIRGCVIMGLDTHLLELLPTRFDPPQTLLYLYDWREAGYDRNYPDYSHIKPQVLPFMQRARELGFRVMLHVNYFGVDPLHPLYPQFEPYQVRSPWGEHAKEWWVWPPEKPDIRFAYINPACRAWRDLFTEAMVQLCEQTGADALHLDQTLCIYNDHNGRIDGMSMLEGNVALHQQLRTALPNVALSGEGLNEATCRHEAFAQRHVWGLDHTKGTYDRQWLAAAHPISSYILRPYTIMYGYLGYATPEDDQTYAAWNEAYRKWGIIPTLKPTRTGFAAPRGFSQQLFDEVRFWQTRHVDIDMDGAWPPDVAFPWRTAEGQPFVATHDRRWMAGTQEISRVVTDTTQLEGTGTIPDWLAYDANRLLGLHPNRWYPYFTRPRTGDPFRVSQLPDDTVIDFVAVSQPLAVVSLQDAHPVLADLLALLEQATCGTRLAQGSSEERLGPGEFANGATFANSSGVLSAHPPWKMGASGEAYARYSCVLPDDCSTRFVTEVYLETGAAGPDKSDGVTFTVRASDGAQSISHQLHQDAAQPKPFELDLSAFRGRTIDLELAVDPGPHHVPSYDWARWRQPRIEKSTSTRKTIAVDTAQSWHLALVHNGPTTCTQSGTTLSAETDVPGALLLLRDRPPIVSLPCDLARSPDQQIYVLDSGTVVESSQYAGATPGECQTAGVRRPGLIVHPPNHGRTLAVYLVTLPAQPARLVTSVGLREGSKSEGVEVSIEVNGSPLVHRLITPGAWHDLDVDLTHWAGQPVVLGLVTDSAGPFNYDWTGWGEPRLEEKIH
ncbi:MAG: DUF6259 domain-containing protein [Pirellulaceae bacterium]